MANSIEVELTRADDPDGFIASAYFNAKLMAVSVDMINRLEAGQEIDKQVSDLEDLAKIPKVQRWLARSRYSRQFADLRRSVTRYYGVYIPGTSQSALQHQLALDKDELHNLETKLTDAKTTSDFNSYNSMVPEFNVKVRNHNSLVQRLRIQHLAVTKLDLSFNKCLDSSILMSKFSQVQLTSHAAEIEALPER